MKKMIALTLSYMLFLADSATACTRFTYMPESDTVITGRSLDWAEDMRTELWALPAGITKIGSDLPNSLIWTSKYGSVIASGYNLGTTDGINTEGLNVNLLYLSSTKFAEPNAENKNFSVLNWGQYFLDNYKTVDEAVKDFENLNAKINIIAPVLPNGSSPTVHLAISDPTGDNAIFEYQDGKLHIYHDKKYTVMTNEPPFEQQLALNTYWQNLNGAFLPGTIDPSDRFVRASYYLKEAPKTNDEVKSIAVAFAIIRNVSAPFVKPTKDRPNVASTLWRTVADLKRNIYYFESTDRPNVFWVDLKNLNLNTGSTIQKLPLTNNQVYAGEVSKQFIEAKPFFKTN